jgi:TatD DNase family protein
MTKIEIIDTHCHLYSNKDSKTEAGSIVQRAMDEGVSNIFMPNVDEETIDEMLHLQEQFSNCHAMMGLHPCHVKKDFKPQLKTLEDWFKKRNFVGVGETGLDMYWDKTTLEEQTLAFHHQIDLSKEVRRPIIIHSRDCQELTIEAIKEKQDGNLTGIFHCFGGSIEEAKQIIDLGFYMGIGGVVTYKKTDLPIVLKDIGLANIVLETDSPYLAPVPHRGKENEPSFLKHIVAKIAEALEISIEEVATVTTDNAKKVFKLI